MLFLSGVICFSACQPEKEPVGNPATGPVDATAIINADPSGWLSHGRTYDEQRHSPLAKIDTENIENLGLAWSFDLEASRGIETTPIVHDGRMYVTSTWNRVFALDAKTGEKLWEFDPDVDRKQAGYACCDVVNRGVAIWGDNVYTATIDGRLIALDAKTGARVWDVLTIDKSRPYTITGAPRIIKGRVMIGNGGAELGVRGYITAYDADTGERLWRFYTVPGNPEDGFETGTMAMAAATWTGEYWKAGGGGTVWDSMAYDPELDLLYFGVGNGSPWNQALRSPGGGDNLFLSSIVAVRPDTGDYVWHYQTTPGETWDFTATQHMILADIEIDGRRRKVIMQAPKNGFFYVIDRATGTFISAKNFVPVNWATHIDPETGRPVEIPQARWGGKAPYLQLPGPLGAHNWHPMSYNPDTGLVYIPAQQAPWIYGEVADFKYRPGTWNTGADFTLATLPDDVAQFKAMKSMLQGRLLAWNPVTQEKAWAVRHGGPWNGGVLSTGGGLVFQGTADAHFAAYDATTGERKWRSFTRTGIVAAPIAYEIDGEQYVAVASGWGGAFVLGYGGVFPTGSQDGEGRVLVYKLGGTATLPATETLQFTLPDPPKSTAAKETIRLGMRHYVNNCVQCHGAHGYASALMPNLQGSAILADAKMWDQIIRGGVLSGNGMPAFTDVLDQDATEAIRAYIIDQANSGFKADFYNAEPMKTD